MLKTPSSSRHSETACRKARPQLGDSTMHWINHYSLDDSINFGSSYSLDTDLSSG